MHMHFYKGCFDIKSDAFFLFVTLFSLSVSYIAPMDSLSLFYKETLYLEKNEEWGSLLLLLSIQTKRAIQRKEKANYE